MRNELLSRLTTASLVVVVASVATAAHAQPIPRDPVTAEALFVEGKRLMQAKDYAAACPKLAESQRLDPSGGTVFAIALCYEGAGMFATASATFNEALAEARRANRPDREAAAEQHVRALDGKLTRLRIDVPHPVPDLEITRNGTPVGRAVWATPVPIDPGTYVFEAKAPGKVSWRWSVAIDRPGGLFSFPVPELATQPAAPLVAVGITPIGATGPTGALAPVHVHEDTGPSGKKSYLVPKVGFVVAGGALAVGAVMGIVASSEWSQAKSNPTSARVNSASTAGTEADVATGFLIGGGVAAVASGIALAVIYASDGPKDEGRPARTGIQLVPTFGPSGVGLSLGGTL